MSDDAKRAELGGLFGLSQEDQAELRSGAGKQLETIKAAAADEEDLFF